MTFWEFSALWFAAHIANDLFVILAMIVVAVICWWDERIAKKRESNLDDK